MALPMDRVLTRGVDNGVRGLGIGIAKPSPAEGVGMFVILDKFLGT